MRFDCKFGENELKMAKDMAQSLEEILAMCWRTMDYLKEQMRAGEA